MNMLTAYQSQSSPNAWYKPGGKSRLWPWSGPPSTLENGLLLPAWDGQGGGQAVLGSEHVRSSSWFEYCDYCPDHICQTGIAQAVAKQSKIHYLYWTTTRISTKWHCSLFTVHPGMALTQRTMRASLGRVQVVRPSLLSTLGHLIGTTYTPSFI